MKNVKIDLDKRQFIKVATLVGSNLFIGFHLPGCVKETYATTPIKKELKTGFTPNAWIKIDKNNIVTIIVNHSEMGQGITTALPMIAAEELEVDWSNVRFEIAPVAKVYKNPTFGTQWTVSSRSVESSWDILRDAGASVRQLLIETAAKTWNVSTTACRAKNSIVYHDASGRTLKYCNLINKTDDIEMPENVPLKKPHEFRIIGQRTPRLDTRIKSNGKAIFGIDVKIPGMLIATVVHPRLLSKGIKSANFEKALASPGVHNILEIDNGIAIVADTFWQANSATYLLEVEWKNDKLKDISSDALFNRWAKLAIKNGLPCFKKGDISPHFKSSDAVIEATYSLPFQAHGTPEPMNCTAHVRKDGCDIWVPTQNQDGTRDVAARITGLDHDQINVHTTFLGGGFGRRALVDYVEEAVQISQKMKAPVQVIWSREEDIAHDYFRPATYNVLKAVLDDQGLPVAWNHRIVGCEVFGQVLPKVLPGMMPTGVPRLLKSIAAYFVKNIGARFISKKKAGLGAGPLDYDIANLQVDLIHDNPGIPVCWWRSVAHSSNCFVVECFLDEIAATSGKDPYEFRKALLANSPRMLHVLELAAEKAGWEKTPPNSIFRGIATQNFQGTLACFIADVSITQASNIKVHRVVCAVDCGIVINPKIVEAQMQSGIVFGLSATLKSSITLAHGKVIQSNFDDFPILRMDEMPKVEVYIVKSGNRPTGIGEIAVPLIAPAVANAVFAATGKPVRELPINIKELVE